MSGSSSSSSSAAAAVSPFLPNCLNGKVALITGGGSGICFEITRQLLLNGCMGVVICGRRAAFLEKACQLLISDSGNVHVYFKVCDVRDAQQCQAAVEFCKSKFDGRLDILINGAAGNFLAQAKDLSPKGFATVMAIDALGTFNMSHAAYPLLSDNNNNNNDTASAIIINISATLQYGATWWQVHASAAKAAVDSMTRSLALEWGPSLNNTRRRVRVNGIAPGPIADTPGTTKLAPGLTKDDVNGMIITGIPLGRMGLASEIGHAAVYLCTAQYVTGHTLVVDGGEWMYREPMVPQELVAELSRQVEAKSRSQGPVAGNSSTTTTRSNL